MSSIYVRLREFLETRTEPASFADIRQGTGMDCNDTQRALRYLRYRGDVVATGPFRQMQYHLLPVPDPAIRLAYQEADAAKRLAKRKAKRDRKIANGTYTAPGKYHRGTRGAKAKPSAPITFYAGAEPETVEQWMARTGQRPEILPLGAVSGNLIELDL